MSKLKNLLERAFENKGNRNRYTDGDWSIGFNERTWDTRFELYYKDIPVLEGNTLDKELKVLNGYTLPLEQFVPEVEKALPEYHFNIRLSLLIPIDFNERWETEVEGAEFEATVDEVRYEDIENGYGYDVVLFSIGGLSDLKNVRITESDGEIYKIDEYEMRLNSKGNVEVTPTCLCPVMALVDRAFASEPQSSPQSPFGSKTTSQNQRYGHCANVNDYACCSERIDTDKLAEYLKDDVILEFESDVACMEYFNTYDGQKFETVEQMKAYQGEYGFGIDGKWFHVCYDDALDVRVPAKKTKLDDVIDEAKSEVEVGRTSDTKSKGEVEYEK